MDVGEGASIRIHSDAVASRLYQSTASKPLLVIGIGSFRRMRETSSIGARGGSESSTVPIAAKSPLGDLHK